MHYGGNQKILYSSNLKVLKINTKHLRETWSYDFIDDLCKWQSQEPLNIEKNWNMESRAINWLGN